MEYVTIHDDQMRLTAVLDHVIAVGYTLTHNDLWTATFALPNDDPKNIYCQPGALVRIPDGQRVTGLYRITGIPDADVAGLGAMTTYNAEHVLATLLDDVIYGTLDIQDKPPAEAITELLAMQTVQRWVLGDCEYTEPVTAALSYETLLSGLQKICRLLPEDYTWDFDTTRLPWVLHIRHADTADGCGIHYARNLVEIKKTVDATQIVTRLYLIGGAGSNGDLVRVEKINDGLDYIEADTAAVWGVRCAIYSNSEITTPEALLQRGRQVLETYKAPYYTYQATALDLYHVTGQAWDNYMPGKLVRVMDDEHGVHFSARIVSVEKKDVYGDPGGVTITIANAPRDQLNAVTALATKVGSLDTGMSSAVSDITKTEIELGELEENTQTGFQQTSQSLALKAEKEEVSALTGRMTHAESSLDIQAEGITALSGRTTALEAGQETTSAQIKVNNDSIGELVTKTTTLEGRVTGAESSIEQYANQISQHVKEFEGRVVTAETAIEQTAKDLGLYVKKDDDISSMIELSGDGVTISGGTITLTGYVKAEDLEANYIKAENLSASLASLDAINMSGGLSANSVHAQYGDFANISIGNAACHKSTLTVGDQSIPFFAPGDATVDLSTITPDLSNYATRSFVIDNYATSADVATTVIGLNDQITSASTPRTLTIGGKSCTFYGPGDATFELSDMPGYDDALAAARSEGASSVTLTAAGWVGGSNVVTASNGESVRVDLPAFSASGGDTFDSNHRTTVYFYTGSVSSPLDSVEVDASSVYDAGYAAGYQAAKDAVKVTAGIRFSNYPTQYYARFYYWGKATIDGEEVGSASGYQSFNVKGAM